MRGETIARNYAEALLELAERDDALERYGEGMETVARLLEENSSFRVFLETPRIPVGEKKDVIRSTFGDVMPKHLVNFILLVIDKRRHRLLREIARAYHDLVDERLNRVRVEVTVARPMAEDVASRLPDALSELLGKKAVPQIRLKPEILGGVIVRAGDRVWDGSLRRRLGSMRRQLLSAGHSAPREVE